MPRYRFLGSSAPYFMTLTVNHWLPVFTRSEAVDILLDSLRFLQAQADLHLHGYVILENHLHLIAGSPQIGKHKRSPSFDSVYRAGPERQVWTRSGLSVLTG